MTTETAKAVPILQVAAHYTKLSQQPNGEYRGLCPLHEENTPSFDVNPDKGVFKCFGCSAGGDVIRLVELAQGLDFKGAVEWLESFQGGAVPETNGTRPATRPKAPAKPKTSKAPADTRHLSERGHDMDFLGMVFGVYETDDWRGTIWEYPTYDADRNPMRWRQKFREPRNGTKYLWHPKQKDLPQPCGYPLWTLMHPQIQCFPKVVWLVNGEPSVWLCWQEGVPAICTMSETSKSRLPELMQLLVERGTKTLHILYDNDEAGENGTIAAANAATDAGLEVVAHRFYGADRSLPSGYDVSDLHADWKADGLEYETFKACLEAQPIVPLAEAGAGVYIEGDSEMQPQDSDAPPEQTDDSQPQPKKKGRPVNGGGSVAEQSNILLEHLAGYKLIRTATNERFIVMERKAKKGKKFHEVVSIRSQDFEDDLRTIARGMGILLKGDTIATVQAEISSLAKENGERARVFVRVGGKAPTPGDSGEVYVDLGSDTYELVKITAEGWKVVSHAPDCFFRRPGGMGALPAPVAAESPEARAATWDAFYHLLKPGSQSNYVKMVAWLLNCFRVPETPYIGLCITGQQNSGKTRRCEMLQKIVDSDGMGLVGETQLNDPRNFPPIVNSCFVLALENMSKISARLSDDLCQIATSARIPMRKMHTNLDLEHIEASRPMIFNGINDFMQKADLKRRFLFVELEPFGPGEKRGDLEVKAEFRALWPRILGVIFDMVSASLRNLEHEDVLTADFGEGAIIDFGRAVAAAELGEDGAPWQEPGLFQLVYSENQHDAAAVSLQDSPLAEAVFLLLAEVERRSRRNFYEQSGQVLYDLLTKWAAVSQVDRTALLSDIYAIGSAGEETHGDRVALWANLETDIETKHKCAELEAQARKKLEKSGWPSSMVGLGRRMSQIAPQLLELGVKIVKPKPGTSIWRLEDVAAIAAPAMETIEEGQSQLIEDDEDVFEDVE